MMGLVMNPIKCLERDTPMKAPMAKEISELTMRLRSSERCSKNVIAPPGSSSTTATGMGFAASIAVPDVATFASSVVSSGGLLGVMGGIVGVDASCRGFLRRCDMVGMADSILRVGNVTQAVVAVVIVTITSIAGDGLG